MGEQERSTQPGEFIRKVRRVIRMRQMSFQTEKNYVYWIKRYTKFHGMTHLEDLRISRSKNFW